MNRRRFLQSIGAAFSLPITSHLSLPTGSAATISASATQTKARFWAIYMSGLNGQCTPGTLQKMLNISEIDAKKYLTKFMREGVIKPNPLLSQPASNIMAKNEKPVFEKLKERVQKKTDINRLELEKQKSDDGFEIANPDELDGRSFKRSETGAEEEEKITDQEILQSEEQVFN